MKSQKKLRNKPQLKWAGPIVITLLVLITLGPYLYHLYLIEQDRRVFMGLKEDMKSLQVELNKVDDAWNYDEYCRGYGSDVARNDLKICNIELSMQKKDLSNNDFELYASTIESIGSFNSSGETPTGSLHNSPIISKDYVNIKWSIPCSLRLASSESESDNVSVLFACSSDSKEYVFDRRH